ncbi:MAG: endonuclease/exonuclease/phosphatase family protein [Arenibacter latericius]|nr:endonuclease/exonuclease/phosphatase family protein [Arenibacter latericius]
MRKRIVGVFVLLSFLSVHLINAQGNKSVKVISYNIWNGFDWGKDTDRKKEFIDWVNTQNPDVFALQELCGYTKEKLLQDARNWGHNYAEILKTDGYPVGITSKEPIEVKQKILDNMHHGALHCKVYGIDIFVIHFSPFNHQKRREEVDIILDQLSSLSIEQDKYLVLGDFNALSPFDAYLYKNKKELLESKRATERKHNHVRNLLDDELEYGVIGALLGYPLIDVVQRNTSTWEDRLSFPTKVFETEKGEGPSENSTRIDYIFSSPFLAKQCINAAVLNKKETHYLSDHYPILAEFKW